MRVTPAMLKAAWAVARQFWPRKVVELVDCSSCRQAKGLRLLETAIRFDDPMPGFKEAIEAALEAEARAGVTLPDDVARALKSARQVVAECLSEVVDRRGRAHGMVDDRGEMLWLVPFETMKGLEEALRRDTGED